MLCVSNPDFGPNLEQQTIWLPQSNYLANTPQLSNKIMPFDVVIRLSHNMLMCCRTPE